MTGNRHGTLVALGKLVDRGPFAGGDATEEGEDGPLFVIGLQLPGPGLGSHPSTPKPTASTSGTGAYFSSL